MRFHHTRQRAPAGRNAHGCEGPTHQSPPEGGTTHDSEHPRVGTPTGVSVDGSERPRVQDLTPKGASAGRRGRREGRAHGWSERPCGGAGRA